MDLKELLACLNDTLQSLKCFGWTVVFDGTNFILLYKSNTTPIEYEPLATIPCEKVPQTGNGYYLPSDLDFLINTICTYIQNPPADGH